MVKEVMQIRFRIVRHPCWSPTKLIKQLRKTILKTVRQPQSPVLVYCWSYWPLPLAQAIQTHCLNQFGFLSLNYKLKDIDQLCCDKKPKDCGSPWSIQMHTFWCNSKRWRILAPNRTKLISLLSLLPAWWIPRFLSSSEVVSVMLLFCCRVYLHWWAILTASVCNMLLCSLYLHWWRTLMPSGCNMCNSGNRLALIACLFISLLSCLVVCL